MAKKLWLFIALCIMMAIPANAEEDREVFTSGEYEYVLLEDGTAEITKYSGSAGELDVPGELDGYSLTCVGESAFKNCESLTSITLPESLTSIGDRAFLGCEWLTSITLPEGATSIGDETFALCSSLTSITLPESLTSIGDYAFSACDGLTSITLPDSITEMGENPFGGCDAISFLVSPDHPYLAVIDGVLFSKQDKRLICCPNQFGTYDVPGGIVSIGDRAFRFCSGLMSITLPDSVTNIGDEAFAYCSSLKSITLEGLASIGDGAFYDCYDLESITLPESLISIGEFAFSGCDNLTITVERDSYAAEYCKENGLNYTFPDANDWLNS